MSITPSSAARPVELTSPDRRTRLRFTVVEGALKYEVVRDDRPLIVPSRLGLTLEGERDGGHAVLEAARVGSATDDYTLVTGKVANVSEAYTSGELTMRASDGRRTTIDARVYDGGIAFRYSVHGREPGERIAVRGERTEVRLAGDPMVTSLALPFGSPYEGSYRETRLAHLTRGETHVLPLLARYPCGPVLGVTESGVVDFPHAYLVRAGADTALDVTLSPRPRGGSLATQNGKLTTPWRAVVIGDTPAALVESNLVTNLAPPRRVADTSWIAPGKVLFGWWNGYVVPDGVLKGPDGKPVRAGVNEATLKHYIDFCARHGIEYVSLDGYEFDLAWYGGRVVPYSGADITKPIPELNLPEVMRYARERGVKVRAWLHADGLTAANMERVMQRYAALGIRGIMVDFIDRDDQERVAYMTQVLETAARHRLTVTFHGCPVPTGLTRTYPHLLSLEAVRGLEYDKWDQAGVTPDHEVTIAYLRMLNGPLDTHQGSFRPVPQSAFTPRSIGPNAIGTLARTLATYVLYENHSPMLADAPSNYERHPEALRFIASLPVVWDETRFVGGTVSESIAIARRRGSAWYVGAITDQKARELSLPLGFLGPGRFMAEIYADTSASHRDGESLAARRVEVNAKDVLRVELAPAGGQAIRFRRV